MVPILLSITQMLVSPPNDSNFKQYYTHHQIDHNLMIEGSRTFTLINPEWDE